MPSVPLALPGFSCLAAVEISSKENSSVGISSSVSKTGCTIKESVGVTKGLVAYLGGGLRYGAMPPPHCPDHKIFLQATLYQNVRYCCLWCNEGDSFAKWFVQLMKKESATAEHFNADQS